jgi:hypothetical protein
MQLNACRRPFVLSLSLAALLTFFAAPHTAWARDLQGRLGLGYNSQFANTSVTERVPGISLKYGLTRDIGSELVVGVATTTPSNSVVALKLFKNLFYETNLNFYFMLGAGILSASSVSGAQFLTGFGAEFFIPGVESLGFSVETGGSFDNMSGSFALRTMGVSFLDAGIHFYF